MGVTGLSRTRSRCRERLAILARSRADPAELRLEAVGDLSQAIGFDQWCWTVADPGPGYCTQGIDNMNPACVPYAARQYLAEETDPFSVTRHVTGKGIPAATLSALTGGDLARSTRWDQCLRPAGLGDEVSVACRDGYGLWGWLLPRRETSDPHFSDEDTALLAAVSPDIAVLTRRVLARPAREAPLARPGTIIVDSDLQFLTWTDEASQWLSQLAGPVPTAGALSAQVIAAQQVVASRAGRPGGAPGVRMRMVNGGWTVLDLAPLRGEASGQYVITIRAATPAEILDVTCRAYALTGRERQLVQHVVRGRSTQQIAQRMNITEYTVKDHLKSVFRKAGTRTRGDLIRTLTG
jgi:DNA-binding CsgD family transcriptional regulator